LICTPRFQGFRPEFLNEDSVSLSSDCIAILDRTDMKTIKVFDSMTGRPIGGGGGEIKHEVEISKLSLSQYVEGARKTVEVRSEENDASTLCVFRMYMGFVPCS